MRRKLISVAVLITLIIVLVTFLIYVAKNPPRSKVETGLKLGTPAAPTGLVKAPTPYLLLPSGKQEYLVQSNPKPGDAIIKKIVADPIEGPTGSDQTITADVKHSIAVTSVIFKLTTDTKTNDYELKLVNGNNKEGAWQGTWKMEDTHAKIYYGKFIIKDESNHETMVNFPIR